jgi:YfiR/HmsC-like
MPTWIREQPFPRPSLKKKARAALRRGLRRFLSGCIHWGSLLCRVDLRSSASRRTNSGIAIGTLCFLLVVAGAAAQPKPSEYDVKAAYLFNFGKFMRLSGVTVEEHRANFEICILGRDPIGHVLDDITANESIDKRAVRVMRIADAPTAKGCDVVFVSADEGDGIAADLTALGKADVLTVSDAPDFLKRGGMIQFVMQEDHVRFAVNLDAVGRTHLVLSSELLRVAMTVTGKPPEEQP